MKLIKSVISLVLKKEKSLLLSAFFYQKRRLKINAVFRLTRSSEDEVGIDSGFLATAVVSLVRTHKAVTFEVPRKCRL